jgi:hypothetical protein
MNQQLKKFAVPGLQWALGLVVLLESVHFTISPSAARNFVNTGLPQWVRLVIGGSEIIAVILFLVPAASMAGGYLLLVIFAIAAGIHFLMGQFGVGSLVVYCMAVIVCMTHRNKAGAEVSYDR